MLLDIQKLSPTYSLSADDYGEPVLEQSICLPLLWLETAGLAEHSLLQASIHDGFIIIDVLSPNTEGDDD